MEYGTNDTYDCIVTKEEALSRLRIRSTPLHGDECSLLREGDRVLATRKSPPKSLFFDAQVEKVPSFSFQLKCRWTIFGLIFISFLAFQS